jgi:hypothetical protein
LVDLITNLPLSDSFDSIMVVVNHGLLKGAVFTPCLKTIDAEGVANILFSKVFSRYGLYTMHHAMRLQVAGTLSLTYSMFDWGWSIFKVPSGCSEKSHADCQKPVFDKHLISVCGSNQRIPL